MSYKKNIASNILTQIINIVLGFLTSIIVVRSLGPDGQGYIAYFILIFGLIADYGDLGINSATTYFQKKSAYSQEEVYNVNISFLLIICSIISGVVIVLKNLNLILNNYSFYIILCGLIFVVFRIITSCVQNLYLGNEKIVDINRYLIINNFIKFVLITVFSLTGLLSVKVYFLVITLGTALNAVLLLKNIKLKYKFKINLSLLKKEFKYGIIIYFAILFSFLNYRVDQFLIERKLGTSELGVYSVGVLLAELLLLIPVSVNTALAGRLYNMDVRSKEMSFITSLTAKYTFYISLLIAVVGYCMTPLIPVIYGSDFLRASEVFIILLGGIVFASIGKSSAPYFVVKGKPTIYLVITSIALLSNIILNLVLIPLYGINGAAVASLFSYFLYGMLHICFFVFKEKIRLGDFFIINAFDLNLLKQIFTNKKTGD